MQLDNELGYQPWMFGKIGEDEIEHTQHQLIAAAATIAPADKARYRA